MNVVTDIVAAVRRTNQTYYEQVAKRTTIACGYAYTNANYPGVADCNFIGEVLLDDDASDPLSAIADFFQKKGVDCHRWVPAQHQAPAPVEKLVGKLGLERREHLAFGLAKETPGRPDERFRLIGARAMRRAYTLVVQQRSAEHPTIADDLTAVQLERLEDPQYDGFVALRDDKPVGAISVYQVGEIGRICDLFVPEQHRRQGVATALMRFAVQTAQRWALRPICLQVSASNAAGRALAEKTGFAEDGTIVAFVRPGDAEVGK